ncbi:MAG: PAS domain-containing protein, partial [Candidatus Hodarchaeales archaeon]
MAIDFPESIKYDSDDEELQKQIARCKDFIELFSEMKELSIFEVDTKGLIQPSFRRGIDLFGYTQQDIDGGLSVLDLFIPEERKKIFQRLKIVLSDVKQPDREYHGLKKDGSVFPVLIYSKPVLKGKKVVGRRGIALDITEIKKIEQKLKESQEHYQRLIELSPDGIVLTTLDGRVVMANKKALHLYGATVESDILGKRIFDFFLPEESQIVNDNIQKLLDKEIISNYEQSVRRIDGSTFSAEISAGIVYDGDHSPKFFISIIRDISLRKIAEIRLQMSEEKYRTLMKNLNVAVYRAHMYGYLSAKIVETNPAFLEMFGYSSL